MSLRSIFVIAFALFTVTLNTACPRDVANDVAENEKLTDEYNDKAHEANSIESDLLVNDGIYISLSSPSSSTWDGKTPDDLNRIHTKLLRYVELMNRLVELSNHKNMQDDIGIDKDQLHRKQASGQAYLSSLNDALKTKTS